MFRLWGKLYKNNDIVRDLVFELTSTGLSTEEKIKQGMDYLCYEFDIQKPMWLSDNTRGLTQVGKTRFRDHHFIEEVEFDYFEIEIIENKA